MSTDNQQAAATQHMKKEERPVQETGLARRSNDSGVVRTHRSGLLGIPLTPYEILRMNPFSLFRRMTEAFDRTLQPFFSEDETGTSIAWTPRVEISHHDGAYRVLAELPGLTPDQVRVEVEDDALILQGERQTEHEADDGGIHRSEREFGFFYRRIPLPEGADPNQATAKFHDGILEITMPAPAPKVERRQIQIETDSKPSSGEAKQAA